MENKLGKRAPVEWWQVLFDCCCKKQVVDSRWGKLQVTEGSVLLDQDLLLQSVNTENLGNHFAIAKKRRQKMEKVLEEATKGSKKVEEETIQEPPQFLTIKHVLTTSQPPEEQPLRYPVTNLRVKSVTQQQVSNESRREHIMRSIDVDQYLQNVKLGDFYLVKHLGRGLFTKFTEIHLQINSKLYSKGRKTPVPEDMPDSVKKYFGKRFTLFGKFDEGIKMDEVGWYSVTPECIAAYTAKRLPYPKILDMFSGVGGNSIQVMTYITSSSR